VKSVQTADPYVLLGWELSYFTGKVRSYLRYKHIPYVERPIDLVGFRFRARRKSGAAAIPIVITPEGRWIQDSSEILDTLEARFPTRSIVPTTPVQRFVAYLLELWGDEFWIPAGMHTRWSHTENYELFEREVGAHLLPRMPRVLQDRAAAYAAGKMRQHLPMVGIVPSQMPLLDRWIEDTLDQLDRHFAVHPYLLGARPSIGDFGLVAPLYGHLGRDPWPTRELIAKRPHVRAYIDRMASPPPSTGDYLEGDRIPETLIPIVVSALREMLPMLEATRDAVVRHVASSPKTPIVPRGLDFVSHPLASGIYRRAALPYTLWMLQRMQDAHRRSSGGDQARVRAMLAELGAAGWLDLEVPRVRRVGLRIAVDGSRPQSRPPV
jgi:glutathione S-transferase